MREAVAEATGAEVVVTEIEGGEKYVLTRGDCKATFYRYGDEVRWVGLRSPGGEDWLVDMHAMVRKVFKKAGIKRLFMNPNPSALDKLLEAGPWKPTDDHGWYVWNLR